ncbi:MAG: glycosyltransferase [Acidobacteria bacterium]|nr:glycosyltransferase [Acidobacteriota bacterium]
MTLLKLSIIIPTHNRPDQLATTVARLRKQTLPANDYELLVIDDGSVPPVQLSGNLSSPSCRIIRLEGVERSTARNAGALVAKGQFLLFLDDDIGVNEDFLADHLRAQNEYPRALVVGAIHLPAENLQTPFGKFRQQLEQSSVPQNRGIVGMPNFCTAANMSINQELYFALGGFNTTLHSAEDQELALRHSACGGRIVFIPEADTVHHDHSLDIQSYCRRVEWGSANVLPFCHAWPDWPQNIERQRINGPLQLAYEPLNLSIRKISKSLLAQPILLKSLFQLTDWLEKTMPQSIALERLYRLLLGIHLQKGYRRGLKLHEKTQYKPTTPHTAKPRMLSDRNSFSPSLETVSKPNLFVVGAPKCGTTSMSDYLAQHPDVFMSPMKEPHFFGRDLQYDAGYIRDEHEYLALFRGARGQRIIGEASTWYLFSKQAAQEIKAFSPDARIIIMLRNPVDMIYSLHGQRLYDCNEDIADFAAALAAEESRRQGLLRPKAFQGALEVYLYREVGKYAEQVQRYLEVFGHERVHFITFEELMADTKKVFQGVCDFLGITSTVPIDFAVKNQMKKLRMPALGRFMRIPPKFARLIFRVAAPLSLRRKLYDRLWDLNVKVEKRPELEPNLARQLTTEFASDVKKLSQLLGRDLSQWMNG